MVKIGRNEPCPCGSEKKYKKCCMGKIDFSETKRITHWSKEEIAEMPTEQIVSKLKLLGVPFDLDDFLKEIPTYYSAEDLSEGWFNDYHLRIEGYDEDFPWMATWELWERLGPADHRCSEQIDDKMREGYDLLEADKTQSACQLWLEVWEDIKNLFGTKMKSVEEADKYYKGEQALFNWVQDLETELGNAATPTKNYKDWLPKRIQYCREFCGTWPRSNEHIIKSMKRWEAESYFGLGEIQKGEEAFKRLVNQYPNWVWGYIGWGDIYNISEWEGQVPVDKGKARRLYKKALRCDEDTEMAKERLEELEEL